MDKKDNRLIGGILLVAGTAIGAAGAALVTQLAVIQSDIANNKSNTDVMADILTAVGDIGIAAGITLSANPETKLLGAGILSASDGITLTGVGIKNWDSVKTNTPIALSTYWNPSLLRKILTNPPMIRPIKAMNKKLPIELKSALVTYP